MEPGGTSVSAGAKGRRRARRIAIAQGLPDPKAVQRYQETRRRRLHRTIHLSACGLLLLLTAIIWCWWVLWKGFLTVDDSTAIACLLAGGLPLTIRPWWVWWRRGKHEKQDMVENPGQWRDIIGRQ